MADEARRIAGSVFGGAADQLKGWFGDESPVDAALGNVKVLRDLFFYYERKPIRARDGGRKDTKTVLKRVLADELVAGKDKSIMLVGHSMGSIIAYDVMRDLGRSDDPVSVSHFATIGSPPGPLFCQRKDRRGTPLFGQACPHALVCDLKLEKLRRRKRSRGSGLPSK